MSERVQPMVNDIPLLKIAIFGGSHLGPQAKFQKSKVEEQLFCFKMVTYSEAQPGSKGFPCNHCDWKGPEH
jgi:hypothetical protein